MEMTPRAHNSNEVPDSMTFLVGLHVVEVLEWDFGKVIPKNTCTNPENTTK